MSAPWDCGARLWWGGSEVRSIEYLVLSSDHRRVQVSLAGSHHASPTRVRSHHAHATPRQQHCVGDITSNAGGVRVGPGHTRKHSAWEPIQQYEAPTEPVPTNRPGPAAVALCGGSQPERRRRSGRAGPHQQEMSHPSRTVRCMEHDTTLHVDCDRCVMQHTTACDDCLVSVVLQMTDEVTPAAFSRIPLSVQPMEFDEAEASAIHALAEAGLVPRLRLVPWEENADLTPESATPPRDTGPTSDPESSSGTGAASRTA